MSQKVGDIHLDLNVNKQGFQKQMNGVMGFAKKAAASMAALFAAKKVFDFGKQAIQLGSDLAEVQNVVDVTFPKMTKQVDDFAKNAAQQFGLSETMAKRYTGTFGAMAKAFGFGEKQAYDMSTALTGLSGDVASFYNISQDEAYTKLKSVFTGETETLKDLGIVMTQNALDAYAMANGYNKTTKEMSEAEKVALRFAFVQQQLSLAAGDFSRTSGSWANQVRLMKLQMEQFMATIGQGLINLFTPILRLINTLLAKVLTLANAFKALTELLTGNKSSGQSSSIGSASKEASNLASGLSNAGKQAGGLGKATDGVGKSAKKAAKEMKALMGFDQINKLDDQPDKSDGGSGSGGGGGGGGDDAIQGAEVDLGKLAEGENKLGDLTNGLIDRFKELFNLFKKGFNATFRFDGIDRFKKALNDIWQLLGEIFGDSRVVEAFNGMLDKMAYALGQYVGALGNYALGIGIFLAESIAGGLRNQKDRIINALVESLTNLGRIAEAAGNIVSILSNTFYDVITSEGAIRIGTAIVSTLLSITSTIFEIGTKLGADFVEGLEKIIKDNAPKLGETLKKSLNAAAPFFETIEQAVNDLGDALNKIYDSSVGPFIREFMSGISELVGVVIEAYDKYINPVIEKFATNFKDVYENHVKPAIDSTVAAFEPLAKVLIWIWNVILKPLIAFILDVFIKALADLADAVGNGIILSIQLLADAWKLLMDVIKIVCDFFISLVDAAMQIASSWDELSSKTNEVWQGISNFIGQICEGIAQFFTDLRQDISNAYNDVAEWFTNKFQQAWNGITNIFSKLGQWFGQQWQNVQNVLSNIANWFNNMFSNAYRNVQNAFQSIGQWFSQQWQNVQNVLSGVANWFGQQFGNAYKNVQNAFKSIGNWFGQQYKNIQNVFNAVGSWFRGKFQEAYNGVTSAFSGIVGFFGGIWNQIRATFTHVGTMVGNAIGGAVRSVINGVLGTVERTINSGIGMLNGAVSLINKLPGVNIGGFSYVNLPRLAQGGYVKANTPQLAMIGDNKRYGEIVAPENKMLEMARKAAELTNKGGNNDAQIIAILTAILQALQDLDLTIDGERLTNKVVDTINEITIRRGESPILQ